MKYCIVGLHGDNDYDDEDEEDQKYHESKCMSTLSVNLLAVGHKCGGRTLNLDIHHGVIYEDMNGGNLMGGEQIEHFFANVRSKF